MFEVGALMDVRGERLDFGDRAGDVAANVGSGRKVGIAEPIVAHHAFLVGVRNGAFLKRVHGGERLLHGRLNRFEEAVGKLDATQVEREAEVRIIEIPLLKMIPGDFIGRLHNPRRR